MQVIKDGDMIIIQFATAGQIKERCHSLLADSIDFPPNLLRLKGG